MKKRIITFVTALSFVCLTVVSVQAYTVSATISARNASANLDNRPYPSTLGWYGEYVVKDINGLTKTIIANESYTNRVILSRIWEAPTHFNSKSLDLDCYINNRFVERIFKTR